ncbi:MAG: helix-turn-helix domain-containing protein [Solirubrobacterales bacterium]
MSQPRDFLEEVVAERTTRNPEFPSMVEQAQARRALLRELAEVRQSLELSQTQVAATMGTSQSSLARLESSAADARLSTVERMASALGLKIQFRLLDASSDEPAVIRG